VYEAVVESEINTSWLNLQLGIFERLYYQVTTTEPLSQVSIGKNHHMASITEVA